MLNYEWLAYTYGISANDSETVKFLNEYSFHGKWNKNRGKSWSSKIGYGKSGKSKVEDVQCILQSLSNTKNYILSFEQGTYLVALDW